MTFDTVTADQQAQVCAFLARPELEITAGLGTGAEHACTIAAINLALTGRLSDGRLGCMSPVIHAWVIRVQDAMPVTIRNSPEWRQAACLIAGSAGSESVEQSRTALLLEWMWTVLAAPAVIQAVPANARPAWDAMLSEKTNAAANAAVAYSAHSAYSAYSTAYAAAYAAVAYSAYSAYSAAYSAAYAATYAANAAAYAANAAAYAANAAADLWRASDPAGTLRRLCQVEG